MIDDGKPKAEADMSAALTAVAGSPFRCRSQWKAIRDVDAADLAADLASRSGRDVRRRAALSVAGAKGGASITATR